MPFIVQCPHADCRKFMLLEDEVRGSTVPCLLCNKPIRVEASGGDLPTGGLRASGSAPSRTAPAPAANSISPATPSAGAGQEPPPVASRQPVYTCPKCQTPLKLPQVPRGASIRCPKCTHVFTV